MSGMFPFKFLRIRASNTAMAQGYGLAAPFWMEDFTLTLVLAASSRAAFLGFMLKSIAATFCPERKSLMLSPVKEA